MHTPRAKNKKEGYNMSFFQKDIETMPRAELEKLQLEKLKHITKYCYDNVPLYKRNLTRQALIVQI